MKFLKFKFLIITLFFLAVAAEYGDGDYDYLEKDNSFDDHSPPTSRPRPRPGSGSGSCHGRGCNNPPRRSKGKAYQGSCNQCGKANIGQSKGRVINGKPVVPIYKYPWFAPLIIGDKLMCGSAIISATYAVTAGHCVINKEVIEQPQCSGRLQPQCYINPNQMRVGLFTANQRTPGRSIGLRRIIGHPMYSFKAAINDIALIQFEGPINCNTYTMPICLPKRDISRPGTPLITAGYGDNTPEGQRGPQILREGAMREINPQVCLKPEEPRNLTQTIVCAYGMESGQSSCHGDSGSAIFGRFGNKFIGVGVVSRGKGSPCSRQNPVIYTKIFAYLDFIKQNVRDLPRF